MTPDHIFLARLQRLTWIPLTPLQLYRARMRRLAEIAEQCGMSSIPWVLRQRSRWPRRLVAARGTSLFTGWAKVRASTWPRVSVWLLLSAADETAALLRAGGAS